MIVGRIHKAQKQKWSSQTAKFSLLSSWRLLLSFQNQSTCKNTDCDWNNHITTAFISIYAFKYVDKKYKLTYLLCLAVCLLLAKT